MFIAYLVTTLRFVSTLTLLVSLTFLLVDGCFSFFCPAQRGSAVYVGFQVLFQLLLVLLLVKRVIVIYC